MTTVTISDAGAHEAAAAADRIPASKAGVKGYLTPEQIKDYILGLANVWAAEQSYGVDIGGLWGRPADNSLNSVNWRFIVNQNPYTDGSGVGGENYANEVTAVGWNLSDTVGVAAVAGKAAIWDNWEYKYNGGGSYLNERHMESLDESGTKHRFFSFAIPHDGGSGSSHAIAVDYISWLPFDASAVKVKWFLSQNVAFFGSSSQAYTLIFDTNNDPPLKQRNAAGNAYLNLPYINGSDDLVIARPISAQGSRSATIGGFAQFQLNGPSNGDVILGLAVAGTAVNTVTGFNVAGPANFALKANVYNTGTGDAVYTAMVGAADGRDPLFEWNVNGGSAFCAGIDNSDSDMFKFAASSELNGTNLVYTVDPTNLNMVFAKPVKVPSHTVANAPSASTYGAGSLIYVTDGNAGSACLAVSDGTNWKVLALGATIAAS